MGNQGDDKSRCANKPIAKRQDDQDDAPCGEYECKGDIGSRKKVTIKTKMISCDKGNFWFHGSCQGLEISDMNTHKNWNHLV